MRVLVTGVTGFVGHHLAALLQAEGHAVSGLVLSGADPVPVGVDVVHGNVTDVEAVGRAIARIAPEGIIHLAGASSVGASFANPIGTWRTNLDGTLAVLEAARAQTPHPRVLCITSGEIYGRVPQDALPVGPHTPVTPLSPYAASKAAADLACVQYHLGYGVPVVRVRAFNHIGPGQDARFVVPNVARQLALAERAGQRSVRIRVGNLETRRDFTDVRDMVRAYVMLLERGDPAVAYLAGTGTSVPIRHLIDRLAAISPLDVAIDSDPGLVRDGEQPDLYGDPGALRALGWEARIPLDTTLADTLEWWRGQATEEA